MRFIILHRTNAHWESGAAPGPQLVARVGALLGEMSQAGVLQAGEGLRPSSQGARLTLSGGVRTIAAGPFTGDREPEGFEIIRAASLDEAIAWATHAAAGGGDVEIDVRPVTEPWDIGMAPPPATLEGRRYMVLRKTIGRPPGFSRRIQALPSQPLAAERMRRNGRGRRYTNSVDGVSVYDGPFAETNELVGGYVIVATTSLDDADRWARRYLDVVSADQVELRELE